MCQPLKQCPRTATAAWCAAEAGPTVLALGSSAASAASAITGGASEATLDFVSFDLGKPGHDMDLLASIRTEGGRRFSSVSWGSLGVDTGMYPYGIVAGGLQEGVISLWNPHAIIQSKGADSGLIHTGQVHQGTVNCVEFHPAKPNLMVTCGTDSEVNIINIDKPTTPDLYKPSANNLHAGSEVLCCAWNRKVQHILCSCSNTGTTVVWDLKQRKEVISFKDPANRQRCSGVAWHPEVPTQLLVAYDDDRQPSMQMWDLRNCQYPFKETAGHSKGILSVAWSACDPNLILSCGKDNRLICWNMSSGSPEIFSEISLQQWNFEVKWAPHKPSLISAASHSGTVSIHSVQTNQAPGTKYCPRWYRKPCGATLGFGGKLLAFGAKAGHAASNDTSKHPSFHHSLVVPNEPEIVPSADSFEQWVAQRKLRDYCHDKTRRCGGVASHEGLMWELMGSQFEDSVRQRVPALLGFDQERILQEAEHFLGKKPGSTLVDPPQGQEDSKQAASSTPAPPAMAELDLNQAESFFETLSATTEQKKREELEREQQKKLEEVQGLASSAAAGSTLTTDWSAGPEALIKQALLVGNLTAAVECCFKSGRMAEALLLASGGGTTLWTRARDEYLRLQGDAFLMTVGNIMTNDFEKLVASSNLANWMETLAIVATYAGEKEYQALCAQLANRLETEKFDIRSAVICYICARNFQKTVSIWANTLCQGSQKLALQDLVEKMAVLQEATKFNQPDSLFNAKLTQYAEILANSGRVTAAMRYLCLLRDDASSSSAILRDRIYNSAPQQMSEMFGRAPPFPFQTVDVRVTHHGHQAHAPAVAAHAAHGLGGAVGGAAARPGHAGPGLHGPSPGMAVPGPSAGLGPRPTFPGAGLPPAPSVPGPGHGLGGPGPMHGGQPMPTPGLGGGGMGGGGMGGGVVGGGLPPKPQLPSGLPPTPAMPGAGGYGGNQWGAGAGVAAQPAPAPGVGMGGIGAGGYGGGYGGAPVAAPAPPPMPTRSTAPTYSAAPVIEGMPVPWPLPAKPSLGVNETVRESNRAVQEASAGGATAVMGTPMPSHDLTYVQNVMSILLEASAQDGNMKKREDISKRLDELYSKLSTGHIKTEAANKVLQMVKAVEAKDYQGANKLQLELCTIDWELNKNWLLGVKRLIPVR